MPRPAVLQVNQLGSWRNAISFDLDTVDEGAMLEAADALGRAINPQGTLKLRIVDPREQPAGVVMQWDMRKGWRPWKDQP